jgi:RNA polymerase sigma factor (sigma-70 family)
MEHDKETSFEEVFKQNERRIYYHIQRLGIHDTHREFYLEGLYAMWKAYQKYEPDKGTLSTYFNYTIRHRLIDMLRKKAREAYKDQMFIEHEKLWVDHGNRSGINKHPVIDSSGISMRDTKIWEEVRELLTENQWSWVYYHVVCGMKYNEIAEWKGVSADAVKSWGRQARRKLRNEVTLAGILELL